MNNSSKKLLVVEDEKSLRTLYGILLKKCSGNISVGFCENGEEGLEEALKDSYDLIISDICMPKMDGISFHKALKNENSEKARNFAFISGNIYSSNLSYIRDEDLPFLEKPFRPNQFMSFVENQLSLKVNDPSSTEFCSNKRKYKRVRKMEECFIHPIESNNNRATLIKGLTSDLSDGGLGLSYDGIELIKGSMVNVIIEKLSIFNKTAKVVWTSTAESLSFKSGLQWI